MTSLKERNEVVTHEGQPQYVRIRRAADAEEFLLIRRVLLEKGCIEDDNGAFLCPRE
jgi:hypothetical protein